MEAEQAAESKKSTTTSEEDIAAGAYDEELNGDDTTSSETTMTTTNGMSAQEMIDQAREEGLKEFMEENGITEEDLYVDPVPDHIEGNPLPEGKYTPSTGELPKCPELGSSGIDPAFAGEVLK